MLSMTELSITSGNSSLKLQKEVILNLVEIEKVAPLWNNPQIPKP
jgi:hypothetical protein